MTGCTGASGSLFVSIVSLKTSYLRLSFRMLSALSRSSAVYVRP